MSYSKKFQLYKGCQHYGAVKLCTDRGVVGVWWQVTGRPSHMGGSVSFPHTAGEEARMSWNPHIIVLYICAGDYM